MGIFSRRFVFAAAILSCSVLFAASSARADSVRIQFAKGDTQLATLQAGAKLFSNEDYSVIDVPSALEGLTFTQRNWRSAADVTMDVPAGTSVYIIIGATGLGALRTQLHDMGWQEIENAHFSYKNNSVLDVYEKDFTEATHFKLIGRGSAGDIMVSRSIALVPPGPSRDNTPPSKPQQDQDQQQPPEGRGPTQASADATWQNISDSTAATRPARTESSIKALYILQRDSGAMLGEADDLILTVTPGTPSSGQVRVRYTSTAGKEMYMVLDDDLRAIRQKYPQLSDAREIDLNFADKYTPHDGGSIGAAVGTLLLSMIQGFDIDPNVAMTGDVSADGKVRAIGGIAAKLKGAADANCTIVAAPISNYDQLLDALIYNGVPEISTVQVIGISNLDDAVAVARMDRSAPLTQAIAIFSDFQDKLQSNPHYLSSPAAVIQLQKVLALEPNHFSAKLLLGVAKRTQRTHLSVTASLYYAEVDTNEMVPATPQGEIPHMDPSVVDNGVRNLRKLRPIADRKTQPFIDALGEFMQGLSEYQQSQISAEDLRSRAQAVLDEQSKLAEDDKLVQQMLKEGI